jgi:hypothetical protein
MSHEEEQDFRQKNLYEADKSASWDVSRLCRDLKLEMDTAEETKKQMEAQIPAIVRLVHPLLGKQ